MKIESFFEEAFYINVDERLDRQQHMTAELSKHGLEGFVKRYSAIKPEVKTPQTCVIASGESHRNIIQYAKDKDLNNILIFEDDVFFKPGGMTIIEESLESLSKVDWDVYYFSSNIFDNPLKLVGENLLRVDGCYCVHAYAVNKKAYDRLLKYNPHTDVPVDAYITSSPFNKYAGYPLAVSQYDSVSDNVGGFIGYDSIFEDVYSRPAVKMY